MRTFMTPKWIVKSALWKLWNAVCGILRIPSIGARALVIKGDQILLVKHTYVGGWHTIGGRVERGESTLQGVMRELFEETGITPTAPLLLLSTYYHTIQGRDDYVTLYICQAFIQD